MCLFINLEAHKTLKHCDERKKQLKEQIDATNEEIQKKRAHLQQTREELKDLSMEESSLRTKRDEALTRCSEIRRKLYASREALQQINKLCGGRRPTSRELSNEI